MPKNLRLCRGFLGIVMAIIRCAGGYNLLRLYSITAASARVTIAFGLNMPLSSGSIAPSFNNCATLSAAYFEIAAASFSLIVYFYVIDYTTEYTRYLPT